MIPITEQDFTVLNGYCPDKIDKILSRYGLSRTTAEVVEDKMTDGSVQYYLREITQ